jgi:hypothetical protein
MNIELIADFFNQKQNKLELYSEAGLQYELALYLMHALPDYYIRLEYPITRVYRPNPGFIKKEMDIYLVSPSNEKYLIELKLPKENCGTPKEMYRAIQDVKFAEHLKSEGFKACYCVLITERISFWLAPQANEEIYYLFNGAEVEFKSIDHSHLPKFLHKNGSIDFNHSYKVSWEEFRDSHNCLWKYYILEV